MLARSLSAAWQGGKVKHCQDAGATVLDLPTPATVSILPGALHYGAVVAHPRVERRVGRADTPSASRRAGCRRGGRSPGLLPG